jgi:hypothetical protein
LDILGCFGMEVEAAVDIRGIDMFCRLLLVMSVSFAFSGCSIVFGKREPPPTPAIESTSGGNPETIPFVLEVVSEENDGTRLAVSGRFVPKVAWASDDVLVRLSALDDTGKHREAYFSLSNPAEPTAAQLQVGKPTEFSLSLPSQGISNYQLELLWGKDAKPLLANAHRTPGEDQEFLALRNLEAYRVPSDDCATPNQCTVKFTLTGEFFNAGSATIKGVSLVAGFARADELDLTDKVLENERRIEVRNMNLAPGGTKPFRLTLEKFIPLDEQVAPRPVVRIVEFDSL